jgi:hypothetical protein
MNPDEVLNSTNYSKIYALLHNVYVHKSDEVLGRALEICKNNFKYGDYNNLLNTILINDLVGGLQVMDQKEISYDRKQILVHAKAYKAKKCEEYLSQ